MEFDIGTDILNSEIDSKTGSISIQVGDVFTKKKTYNEVEMWQFTSFASRPALAQPGKDAAQGIFINLVDQNICLATRDIRDQKIYGNLGYGECTVYASGPNNVGTARSMYKDDGSVCSITHLIQEGNTSSGKPILMQISSDGKINIANSNYGAISIDSNGVSVASKGTLNLGSTGAMALIGSTMALNAGSVTLGANASQPIALAPDLISWAGALVAYLAVMDGKIAAITSTTPGSSSGAAPALAATVASTSVKAAG
jgi:hypothetical protein